MSPMPVGGLVPQATDNAAELVVRNAKIHTGRPEPKDLKVHHLACIDAGGYVISIRRKSQPSALVNRFAVRPPAPATAGHAHSAQACA